MLSPRRVAFSDMPYMDAAPPRRETYVVRADWDDDQPTRGSPPDASSVCVVLLAILITIILWNMHRTTAASAAYGAERRAAPWGFASAMRARAPSLRKSGVASARNAKPAGAAAEAAAPAKPAPTPAATPSADDALLDKEVQGKMKESGVQNLTPCAQKDYKSVPTSEKAKNDESVKRFVDAHPDAILLIWAPWCPHCHKAMPAVAEAAGKVKEDVPTALVNAEMVSPSLISGTDGKSVAKVTHFPFLMRAGAKEVHDGPMTADAIVDFARKGKRHPVEGPRMISDAEKELLSYF